MARILRTVTQHEDLVVDSVTVVLPTHVTGNIIVIHIGKDTNTENISTPSGWTEVHQLSLASNGRAAVFTKTAASGSETNPTFTWTTAVACSVSTTIIEGSSGVDVSATATDNSGPPYAAPSVTTTGSYALVLFFTVNDTTASPTADPGSTTVVAENCGATTSIGMAWRVQAAAGATGVCNFTINVAGTISSAQITIAFADSSSGTILPAYPQPDFAVVIDALRGTATTAAGDTTGGLVDAINWYNPTGVTLVDPTSAYSVVATVPTYTDLLAAITEDTDNDVSPFPAVEIVGDYFVIGFSVPVDCFIYDRVGCVVGAGGSVVAEYWNGIAWAALLRVYSGVGDSASQFLRNTAADGAVYYFARPATWATLSLNGETADYKIRYRITTVYTTNPTISRVRGAQSDKMFNLDVLAQDPAGSGIGTFDTSMSVTPASQSPTICAGSRIYNTTVRDISGGLLAMTFQGTSGAALRAVGPPETGGFMLGVLDSSNNCYMWSLAALGDTDTDKAGTNVCVIDPAQSVNTRYLESSTGPTLTDIKRVLLACRCVNAAPGWRCAQIVKLPGYITISGGGTTTPVTETDVIAACNSYPFPWVKEATLRCLAPLKFGGYDRLIMDSSGLSLSFPTVRADDPLKLKAHVDADVLGVYLDARTGDTCILNNFSLSGNSVWRFEIMSTASASATWGLSGTVRGAHVILRPVTTFSSISFVDCSEIEQNASVLGGCLFSNSPIDCDDPDGIDNCTFTSGGTGHALVLPAAAIGTHAFEGNTFSGYGADETTDAAIYNNSGGLVTLQLAAGDTVPTVRNGAGASTVIEEFIVGTTLQAPNIPDGATVGVYNVTQDTVLDYVASLATGTGYSITLVPGTDYDVGDDISFRAIKVSGVTATLEYTFDLATTIDGGTIPLSTALESDTVYNTLAIDGSTITDYDADYVDDEVDIIVAANFYVSEWYAWWVYNLTTTDGMRRFWKGITAEDIGNYMINVPIVSIKLDNTTATEIWALDNRRIRRSDEARPVRFPTSGGGGIDVEWREQVLLAETGVSGLTSEESTQLMALGTPEDNATAVGAGEIVTGWSRDRALRKITAMTIAKSSGNTPTGGTVVFRNLGDTADEMSATVDANGNRTAVTQGS